MKNNHNLVVSISTMKDIDLLTEFTKYINIDITNCDHDIIEYFMKNGENYLYSEIIDNTPGYIYVDYNTFYKAETIINSIYASMPNNLTALEIAKYLYINIAKYVYFDINIDSEKNENYNFFLTSNINNLWGSFSSGRINNKSITKIYYYLCKRLDIDIKIEQNNIEIYNKIIVDKQIINTNLYKDIPYIKAKLITKHFNPYNEDIELDKKIKYIKNKYNDALIDKALKNIDYMEENCIEDILYKTQEIIDIDNIRPVELSIIYEYLFEKYCPNYDIKINNLYLNNIEKSHFIMISYNNRHYSYNYNKKSFIEIKDYEIIDNINNGKIGMYIDELIPNLQIIKNA